MQSKLLHELDGQRTFAVILETGDEVVAELGRFVAQQQVGAAQLTAIGAFSGAVLGFFDWQSRTYLRNEVREQVEVAAMIGDVALGTDGKPSLHVHLVLGRRDGSAVAGHLLEGQVRPTLEVVLTEQPAHLHKCYDAESGLALIRNRPGSDRRGQ